MSIISDVKSALGELTKFSLINLNTPVKSKEKTLQPAVKVTDSFHRCLPGNLAYVHYFL